MEEYQLYIKLLLSGFAISVAFGFIAVRTRFCPLGGIRDWVTNGHTGRLCAYLLAGAVAIIGVVILEAQGVFNLDQSRAPYRISSFMWSRYILGGLFFGVGMTLCSGCGMRNMLRLGGGNLKALLVLFAMGLMGYWMTRPTPSGMSLYEQFFHPWIPALSLDLAAQDIANQDLGSVLAGVVGAADRSIWRIVSAVVIAALLLIAIFKSSHIRERADYWFGAIAIGVLIVASFYITGGSIDQELIEEVAMMDEPPNGVGISIQRPTIERKE